VLKAMRRGYTVERYLARLDLLRSKAPDIELHSDFIVGYPGETVADFDATVDLVNRVGFAQSYVFKYSPRPGTLAAELPDDVPDAEKERRNHVLLAAQEALTWQHNRALVGKTTEVLVEGESKVDGRLSGRTAHHRLVHFASQDMDLIGQYVPVLVTEALAHSVVGDLLATTAAQEGAHDRSEVMHP
jgi:tRNA-2-methylthio-N6-dimethylallyladenosine synthase